MCETEGKRVDAGVFRRHKNKASYVDEHHD